MEWGSIRARCGVGDCAGLIQVESWVQGWLLGRLGACLIEGRVFHHRLFGETITQSRGERSPCVTKMVFHISFKAARPCPALFAMSKSLTPETQAQLASTVTPPHDGGMVLGGRLVFGNRTLV